MELTDEQYSRIQKYVEKEMDEAEQAAFKAMLGEQEDLNDEVELYREIRSLSASIDQKLSTASLDMNKKNEVEGDDIGMMIKQARGHWENEHENDLKLKFGISNAREENTVAGKQARIRKMNIWKKLAVAATILGIISVSITWYFRSSEETEKTALNNKVVENTGQPDTLKNIASPLTPKTQNEKLPPVPIAKQESNKTSGQQNDSSLSSTSEPLSKVKREALFAANSDPDPATQDKEGPLKNELLNKLRKVKREALFKANFDPDLAPQDKEGPLKTALLNYENKNYSEAIDAFTRVDLGPVTRGEAEDSRIIITFHMHYYKALSNMAADTNISNAISELKSALRTSSDIELQTKAQWYLALAYLKNDEVNNAMQLLRKLADKNASPVYRERALQLIKELQNR